VRFKRNEGVGSGQRKVGKGGSNGHEKGKKKVGTGEEKETRKKKHPRKGKGSLHRPLVLKFRKGGAAHGTR